jgi:valyl-tRNA synthetase
MSKSKGNVVTPADMLDKHGSDAVRYWAASSRLGTDAAFDPQNPTQIKIGRRLAIKILNASKFVSMSQGSIDATVTEPVDQSMLAGLTAVVAQATTAFENYDHARALETTESFFWTFCDDYLELVKERAYGEAGPEQASAVAALRTALATLLRLFAPFVPFATEEAWSWSNEDSVHTAPWPVAADLLGSDEVATGNIALLDLASRALTGIRRAKTDAKASQKSELDSAVICGAPAEIALLTLAAADLKAVGRIRELTFVDGSELAVTDIVFATVLES